MTLNQNPPWKFSAYATALIDNDILRFTRGLVSDDHAASTGRNGQWKSQEKIFLRLLSLGGSLKWNQQGKSNGLA